MLSLLRSPLCSIGASSFALHIYFSFAFRCAFLIPFRCAFLIPYRWAFVALASGRLSKSFVLLIVFHSHSIVCFLMHSLVLCYSSSVSCPLSRSLYFSFLHLFLRFVLRSLGLHPRRPRGKIIGLDEDKTVVSVDAKVYFHTTKVNFHADRNRRFIFLAPDNLAPGSPRMLGLLRCFFLFQFWVNRFSL